MQLNYVKLGFYICSVQVTLSKGQEIAYGIECVGGDIAGKGMIEALKSNG